MTNSLKKRRLKKYSKKDIIDLELKAIMLEYSFIDTDVQTRKTAQQSLTNQAMILIAAAIPIIFKFIESEYINIVLFVPLFFVLLGILLFEHDYQIIIKADFKHNILEPIIEKK